MMMLVCDCRKRCTKGSCLCIDNRFEGTDSCNVDSCGNMQNNDEDESNSSCLIIRLIAMEKTMIQLCLFDISFTIVEQDKMKRN